MDNHTPANFECKFHFDNLEEATQDSVRERVAYAIDHKMSGILLKIHAHRSDARVLFRIDLQKNKKDLFNGTFSMYYPGIEKDFDFADEAWVRYEREDYVNLNDLVSHAFSNFKERFANS